MNPDYPTAITEFRDRWDRGGARSLLHTAGWWLNIAGDVQDNQVHGPSPRKTFVQAYRAGDVMACEAMALIREHNFEHYMELLEGYDDRGS